MGFGADAHSFDGSIRYENVESPGEYVARIRQYQSPRLSSVTAKLAEERFLVGLRLTQGLRLDPEDWTQYNAPIQRFLDDGLLTQKGDRLMLTNRGVMLSNEVIAEFITL